MGLWINRRGNRKLVDYLGVKTDERGSGGEGVSNSSYFLLFFIEFGLAQALDGAPSRH